MAVGSKMIMIAIIGIRTRMIVIAVVIMLATCTMLPNVASRISRCHPFRCVATRSSMSPSCRQDNESIWAIATEWRRLCRPLESWIILFPPNSLLECGPIFSGALEKFWPDGEGARIINTTNKAVVLQVAGKVDNFLVKGVIRQRQKVWGETFRP